jgi:hypothetical protein
MEGARHPPTTPQEHRPCGRRDTMDARSNVEAQPVSGAIYRCTAEGNCLKPGARCSGLRRMVRSTFLLPLLICSRALISEANPKKRPFTEREQTESNREPGLEPQLHENVSLVNLSYIR